MSSLPRNMILAGLMLIAVSTAQAGTLDYKDSFGDSNWAAVTSVDVGMYVGGLEVACGCSGACISPRRVRHCPPQNLNAAWYLKRGLQ